MRCLLAIVLLTLLQFPLTLGADDEMPAVVDRVEEDWELVISTPDTDLTCPQVQTLMKLDSNPNSAFLVFNINYRELPSFYAGGLQVRIQDGDAELDSDSEGSAQLATNDETITWTQRLSIKDGELKFKVTSGSSTTWGNFGMGDDDLSAAISTNRTSLADYTPQASVTNSGPGFGSNRVSSMKLLQVRYYHGDDLISTDNGVRVISLQN